MSTEMTVQEIENQVDKLRCQSIYILPREIDFSQGYGYGWTIEPLVFEALNSHQVREYCDQNGIAWKDLWDEDAETWKDEFEMEVRFDESDPASPVGSIFYLLPDFDLDDVSVVHSQIRGLVTIIGLGDEEGYGLALTGYGMDMTWDLIQAYVVAGYLPPLELVKKLGIMGNSAHVAFNPPLLYAACEKTLAYVNQDVVQAEEYLQKIRDV